jgi:ABC-type transporter Mla MlaB component
MGLGPEVELAIRRPLARSDLPGLYRRACAALERCRDGVLICDVSAVPADRVAVEALARLALGARRHRCRVQMRGSTAELDALIELVGLGETLSLDPPIVGGDSASGAELGASGGAP